MPSATTELLGAMIVLVVMVGALAYVASQALGLLTSATGDVEVHSGEVIAACRLDWVRLNNVSFTVIAGIDLEARFDVLNSWSGPVYPVSVLPMGGAGREAAFYLEPERLEPGSEVEVRAPIIQAGVYPTGFARPGDVIDLSTGFERVRTGLIAEYALSPPLSRPAGYECPLGGSKVYDARVSGAVVSAEMGKPGCAPLLASQYGSGSLLVLGAFNPLDYYYEEWDATFYLDIKTSTGARIGFAFKGAPGEEPDASLLGVPGAAAPVEPGVVYYAFYASRGVQELWIGEDREPRLTAAFEGAPTGEVVVGLAREKPARGKPFVALAIDSSGSMEDDWAALVSAIEASIDFLSGYDTYLALLDFTSPEKCSAGPYDAIFCSKYVRVWTDFTTDYELVASIARNMVISGGKEPATDAVAIAAQILSWDKAREGVDVKVVVVASDEGLQEQDYTKEEAIRLAREKGIRVFVVRPAGAASSLDVLAVATGGEVLLLGSDASNLGEAIVKLIERLDLKPARLASEFQFLGVYAGRTVTVTGLYPGDILLVAAPSRAYTFTVDAASMELDLLSLFTPRELVEAMMLWGGVRVTLLPSPEKVLSRIPENVLVEVRSLEGGVWQVPVELVKRVECRLPLELEGGTLRGEAARGVYKLYIGGPGWEAPYYAAPRVKASVDGVLELVYGGAVYRVEAGVGGTLPGVGALELPPQVVTLEVGPGYALVSVGYRAYLLPAPDEFRLTGSGWALVSLSP